MYQKNNGLRVFYFSVWTILRKYSVKYLNLWFWQLELDQAAFYFHTLDQWAQDFLSFSECVDCRWTLHCIVESLKRAYIVYVQKYPSIFFRMRNRKYFRRAIKVQLFSYLIEKKREIFYLFFNSVQKKIFEKALKDVSKIIKQHLSLRPYYTT